MAATQPSSGPGLVYAKYQNICHRCKGKINKEKLYYRNKRYKTKIETRVFPFLGIKKLIHFLNICMGIGLTLLWHQGFFFSCSWCVVCVVLVGAQTTRIRYPVGLTPKKIATVVVVVVVVLLPLLCLVRVPLPQLV